jgi:hypothetical protein
MPKELLNIERNIKAFINSRLYLRAAIPEEVAALAKLREAMALIVEARVVCDAVDHHRYVINTPRYTPEELQHKVQELEHD